MRHLNWHGDRNSADDFAELAEYARTHPFDADVYGQGKSLNAFEARIATLLGMEAAVFMPSGVMAQQVALRIWADQTHCRNVALHPSNHVEVNEHRAYAHLHDLRVLLLGGKTAPILAGDLKKCAEPLGTLLIELPLRRIGGILPAWEEQQALIAVAKERGIRLHLDGARLWETQAFYDRPLDELCRGFDSVYVSFYKGLGGLAGAMLLGSREFIAHARIWQRRHGGNLITILPFAVSAQLNFEKRAGRMKQYRDHAIALAAALQKLDGAELKPAVPQVNMFHLYMHRPLERIQAAHEKLMAADQIKICNLLLPSEQPGWCYTEIVVNDCALEWTPDEVCATFAKLLKLAS